MWLLGLEACLAMCLLIFIVWWTMFQGQRPRIPPTKVEQKSELEPESTTASEPESKK